MKALNHKEPDLKMPKIGLTFSRSMMPQLGPTDAFLRNLDKHGVKYTHEIVDPHTIKASQSEFNHDAIRALIQNPKKARSSVVISADNHAADGHHRFIASMNRGEKQKVIRVHLPILDLIKLAKTFHTTSYKTVHDVKTPKNIMESIKSVIRDKLKREKT